MPRARAGLREIGAPYGTAAPGPGPVHHHAGQQAQQLLTQAIALSDATRQCLAEAFNAAMHTIRISVSNRPNSHKGKNYATINWSMPTILPSRPSSKARAIVPRNLVVSPWSPRNRLRALSLLHAYPRVIRTMPAMCCPCSTRSKALSSVSGHHPSSGSTQSRGTLVSMTRHRVRRSMREGFSRLVSPRTSSPLPPIPVRRRSALSSPRQAYTVSGPLTKCSWPVSVAIAVPWWKVTSASITGSATSLP